MCHAMAEGSGGGLGVVVDRASSSGSISRLVAARTTRMGDFFRIRRASILVAEYCSAVGCPREGSIAHLRRRFLGKDPFKQLGVLRSDLFGPVHHCGESDSR